MHSIGEAVQTDGNGVLPNTVTQAASCSCTSSYTDPWAANKWSAYRWAVSAYYQAFSGSDQNINDQQPFFLLLLASMQPSVPGTSGWPSSSLVGRGNLPRGHDQLITRSSSSQHFVAERDVYALCCRKNSEFYWCTLYSDAEGRLGRTIAVGIVNQVIGQEQN